MPAGKAPAPRVAPTMATRSVPALFTLWEEVIDDLLDRTMRFPKAVRFTFSARIAGLGE